jgi:hypothetical protein
MKPDHEKRVRLSLETKASVLKDLRDHQVALGERSMIGLIRRMLQRSKELLSREKP